MAQFAMYALIAIGLNVVVGQAGLLDLGYVGFYAVGAYTVGLLTSPQSPWNQTDDGWLNDEWAWLACLPIAIVDHRDLRSASSARRRCGCAATTWPSSRSGSARSSGCWPTTSTEITDGGRGLSGIAYPRFGESEEFPQGVFSAGNVGDRLNSGVWWYWLAIVLIIIVLLFVGNLERSRVGRAWVAIREDEDAAEIMGVPTFKFKLWAFTIGAGDRRHVRRAVCRSGAVRGPARTSTSSTRCCSCARSCSAARATSSASSSGAFIIVYLPNFFLG